MTDSRQRLGVLIAVIATAVVLAWQVLAGGPASPGAAPGRAERGSADGAREEREGPPRARDPLPPRSPRGADDGLPAEVDEVLARIARGGPFPYRQDGGVFQNREGRLPGRPRGYYREYTVPTPGERDRGPRRIVTGGDPPTEYFYTGDHYRTFRAIGGPR